MRSVVLVALVVCGCGKASSDPARPAVQIPGITSDGVDLTYKDLLEKLKAGGYPKTRMAATKYGQIYALEATAETNFDYFEAYLKQGGKLSGLDLPLVICNKRPTVQDASEEAGRSESGTWAWGRFSFVGTEKSLAAIKKALAK